MPRMRPSGKTSARSSWVRRTSAAKSGGPTSRLGPRAVSCRCLRSLQAGDDSDVTHWSLREYCGGPVDLTLAVPRWRWALGANRPPEHWEDKPLPLRLADCEATSERRLWVRWPYDESVREAAVRLGS